MKNIMIIDNQKKILEIIKEILEQSGYNVFTFEYFRVALKFYRLRHQQISLILLDMQLSDINHEETFLSLLSVNPDAKIIGMSGVIYPVATDLTFQNKFTAFLQKPFPAQKLISEVSQVYHKNVFTSYVD